MWKTNLIFLCFVLPLTALGDGFEKTNIESPVTVEGLRAGQYSAELVFEKHLYDRDKITGDLYSYKSDGLIIKTLVNTPKTTMPKNGYPILIYAHGFHPEPKKYGVTKEGITSRPGDYYRGIPERYAEEGYLVLTPDYRGHNVSQGFEFTQRPHLTTSYYAVDVLNLLAATPALAGADSNRIFYAGHSMGGEVGLKVLLASDKIRAASMWSPAVGSTYQSVLYYGHLYDEQLNKEQKGGKMDAVKIQQYAANMKRSYEALPKEVTPLQVDPINHIHYLSTPLLIQHARGDQSVPYQWAENLALELYKNEKGFHFYAYDSDNHLFEGVNLQLAFERDLAFFNQY